MDLTQRAVGAPVAVDDLPRASRVAMWMIAVFLGAVCQTRCTDRVVQGVDDSLERGHVRHRWLLARRRGDALSGKRDPQLPRLVPTGSGALGTLLPGRRCAGVVPVDLAE